MQEKSISSVIHPRFFVLEGIDGVGKSTQMHALEAVVPSKDYHFTCEPTNSPLGAFIRSQMRATEPVHSDTWAYLFATDRCEHLYGQKGIVQRLQAGKKVICDRYLFSSLVYQGLPSLSGAQETVFNADLFEKRLMHSLPFQLNRRFLLPGCVFYLSLEEGARRERMHQKASEKVAPDSFEENTSALQLSHALYLQLLHYYTRRYGVKVVELNAHEPPEKLTEQILPYLCDE